MNQTEAKKRQRMPKGEKYHFIDDCGFVETKEDNRELLDDLHYKVGNYFPFGEEEEAESAVDKMNKEEILERIEKALLANFDKVSDLKEPRINLNLIDAFPFPKSYVPFEGDFIDELFGYLQKDLSISYIQIGVSVEHEDRIEHVNEISLDDLNDEELENLARIAESHKGDHYGKNHKIFQSK